MIYAPRKNVTGAFLRPVRERGRCARGGRCTGSATRQRPAGNRGRHRTDRTRSSIALEDKSISLNRRRLIASVLKFVAGKKKDASEPARSFRYTTLPSPLMRLPSVTLTWLHFTKERSVQPCSTAASSAEGDGGSQPDSSARGRDGRRGEFSFGEVASPAGRAAGGGRRRGCRTTIKLYTSPRRRRSGPDYVP
ncbi:hypothetical protein EVAR_46711_1 [Eumeta japonica]|uniref:Uncharacterized protein n=1 Tax=Eumeta variegata TaxID=151549 RepID=A0A4C1XBC2_EUMVA|nr:hypothetical protein EVAR_46711_1 [Eumeta japonica]